MAFFGLSAKALEHWKGILSILVAMGGPFGAFAVGEASIMAACILAGIAGLSALYNWVDTSLEQARQRKLLTEAALSEAENSIIDET